MVQPAGPGAAVFGFTIANELESGNASAIVTIGT
jgi:hypothetical protein